VNEGHQQTPAATVATHDALGNWRPGESLRAIRCRTLVIAGAKDIVVPPLLARRAAEVLSARFVLLANVGHSPPIEAPETFARLLFGHIGGQV
jgi:pimeloyl-ACP methyl ester carboxylesterase